MSGNGSPFRGPEDEVVIRMPRAEAEFIAHVLARTAAKVAIEAIGGSDLNDLLSGLMLSSSMEAAAHDVMKALDEDSVVR